MISSFLLVMHEVDFVHLSGTEVVKYYVYMGNWAN